MSDESDGIPWPICALVAFIIAIICFAFGAKMAHDAMMGHAVKNNAAHYEISGDGPGTVFVWGPKK